MRLFGKKPAGPRLPLDIAARMERFGRHEIDPVGSRDDASAVFAETQQPFLELSRTDPSALIQVLAEACLPVGGWAVYGAERTVVNLIGTDSPDPKWLTLLDGSIEFLRSNFVPPMRVAQYAWMRFVDNGGTSNTWLPLRSSPDRESTALTPLRPGEERRLLVMAPEQDANVILVREDGNGEVVAVVDARQSDDDPTRSQWEYKRAGDLHALYADVAWSCQVWHWCDPELEPFFPAPKARI